MSTPTTLIMAQDSTRVVMVPSAAYVSSFISNLFNGAERFGSVLLELDVTVVSGTGPTLNVYFQTQLPDGVNYTDLASFTQMSATGKRAMCFVGGGNLEYAVTDGTLAAGTMRNHLIGSRVRIKSTLGGTNPSFTFSVSAEFYA